MIYNRDSDIAKSQQASGLGLYFPDKIASEATLLEGQSQLGLRLYAPLHREFSVGDRKFPPNSGKFPPNSGEFAPNRQKPEPQIKAWEILWDHYIALQFNKDTGWADFVREFVELTAEADNREENSP